MTKLKFLYFTLLMAIVIGLLAPGCAVRRSTPIHGPLALENEGIRNGEIAFMAHCQKCHPIGEPGLGPALNSSPAPKFLKKFQVRHGLGMMPSFSDAQIPDQELQNIVDYLAALKRND